MLKLSRKPRSNRNSASRSSLGLNRKRPESDVISVSPGLSFSDCQSQSDVISVNDETIIINVGGQVFETYISTLNRLACKCKLTNEVFLRRYFRSTHGDFFFDRDPDVFRCVLNLLRTGQLDVPLQLCGPTIRNELSFWGAHADEVEGCCWTHCKEWKTQKSALDKMGKWLSSTRTTQEWSSILLSPWQRIRRALWVALDDPFSSTFAKVFSWVSLGMAVCSIFIFCVETHPAFQVCVQTAEMSTPNETSTRLRTRHVIGPLSLCNRGTGSSKEAIKGVRQPHTGLVVADFLVLFFFTVEFLLKIICSPIKRRYMVTFMNVLDCFALLPDYIRLTALTFDKGQGRLNYHIDALFVLRIFRLFRAFRLSLRLHSVQLFLSLLAVSIKELILMLLYLSASSVLIGSLVYFAEQASVTDLSNIPIGLWWSFVTMTTVGYGDIVPKTSLGRFIGSLCCFNGILILSLTLTVTVGNYLRHRPLIHYNVILKRKTNIVAPSEDTLDSASLAMLPMKPITQCCSKPQRPSSQGV